MLVRTIGQNPVKPRAKGCICSNDAKTMGRKFWQRRIIGHVPTLVLAESALWKVFDLGIYLFLLV